MKEKEATEEDTRIKHACENTVFIDKGWVKQKQLREVLNSPSGQNKMSHSWWGSQWRTVTHRAWWKVVIWGRSRVNSRDTTSGRRQLQLCPKPPSPLLQSHTAHQKTDLQHMIMSSHDLPLPLHWEEETCPVKERKWDSPVSRSWEVLSDSMWPKFSSRAEAARCCTGSSRFSVFPTF